jgi:protein phosphatase 1A/protein phosphatase 2C family protein 2/3/protein phosphatase 1G
MDGHGGDACSEFSSKRVMAELLVDLRAGLVPLAALVNAHAATEVAWMRRSCGGDDPDDSGTTSVCVLIDEAAGELSISNVGDSRALLLRRSRRGGKRKRGAAKAGSLAVLPLTTDQDAENKGEAKRIKAAGGTVSAEGYINESVQTARSIGDYLSKFLPAEAEEEAPAKHSLAVISTPAVSRAALCEDDVLLVLGCDGLFETDDEARDDMAWIAELCDEALGAGASVKKIAKRLADDAIAHGSSDNTTALVVDLRKLVR